jgi:chromate transport protein ChrA
MNKIIHAVILAVFGIACFFVWGMLMLAGDVRTGGQLPAFTRLCIGLRPVVVALPIAAAAYCIYIWTGKTDGRRPWIGFFAVTMCALVLVALPTFVAAYLPLIESLNQLASK